MTNLELASNICGWLYVACWGLFAYPQIYLNWKLKSVEGFKMDYPFLNLSGYAFVSIAYSVAFFGKQLPYDNYGYGTIRIQDLIFVYHNLFTSIILNLQSCFYKRGKNRLSIFSILFTIFAWISSITLYILTEVAWLIPENIEFNVFLYLGYLKVAVTLFKYIPLVYWNYERKSTVGFAATSFIFDFLGASFSLSQEIIDYADETSDMLNPIKFGLGTVSAVYDLILLFQHFVLYKGGSKRDEIELAPKRGSKAYQDAKEFAEFA